MIVDVIIVIVTV